MTKPSEEAEGRRFDRVAMTYDTVDDARYPVRGRVREEVVRIVRKLGCRKVLDMGCGTGKALIKLAPGLDFGMGVDVSRQMLKQAQRAAAQSELRNVRFTYGSFLAPPHELGAYGARPTFDAVISTYALHHLDRKAKREALARCTPLLLENGVLVIGDLMFAGAPERYVDEYGHVGYNPSTDKPELVTTLVEIIESLGFEVACQSVHPLAGILVGCRAGVVA